MKKNVSTEASSGSVTQQEVDSCVNELGRLTTTTFPGVKALSVQDRKRLARPRKDGASFAREIAQLVGKYGLSGVVDVTGMLNAVTQAELLAPLDKAATNFGTLVHDQALAADSVAWKSATRGYTLLKRLAKDDPALARDLTGLTATLKKPSQGASTAKSGKSGKTKAKATAQTKAATPEPAPAPSPEAPATAPPAK